MKLIKKRFALISSVLLFLCTVFVLYYHAVDNSLTKEDRKYIPFYLNDVIPLPENPTYKDELTFIISIQRSVLTIVPRYKGIPRGQKREPKELYISKTGLCYDRSRVIEKILRYSDFKTRHVSIYMTTETGSKIRSLITPGVGSHAVTEVLTKRGWLIVDSNAPWVSTDKNDQPIPLEYINLSIENSLPIKWNKEPPLRAPGVPSIYVQPFTFVYGLYSRHGYYYPPYNFVPDINYGEFFQNYL